MPRRDDINRILILGSGPIVIGQAAEFDYSGVQACKVLREEGYEVVLVNSNPATIMTDPEFADATYVEPITPDFLEKVIAKERPDALLATLGGQTALNAAMALDKAGVLEKYGVATVSHVCLNDDVVEGLELRSPEGELRSFSVQYHPEAAAGPHDAAYLFDRFADLMSGSVVSTSSSTGSSTTEGDA